MNKILILILLYGGSFNNAIQAQITAMQMGMLDFKVSQNLTVAEMNGTLDVTAKLQAAVNTASLANRSLFIPSGTYLVSNQIKCILTINNWVSSTPVNIIGSSVKHPVIKLADNTASFQGANPKAVIHYTNSDPATYGTDAVMEGGIRAVDFDLGAGNTNAVALYWGCAQYCFIEDINIKARDGFAGLTGIGGANQLLANITVDGGKYGLYLPSYNEGVLWGMPGSPQNTITGCTFTNQTEEALWLRGWGGITIIGTTIVKNSGIAIKMACETYSAVVQFPFSMIDSQIEFTNAQQSNVGLQNLLHGDVSLRGVYIKGAGKLCDNATDEDLTPHTTFSDWTHVARFNYIDKSARNDDQGNLYVGSHFNALNGTRYNIAEIEKNGETPPSDLTSRHIWASTPSFEDADAFLVPAGSTAAQIQSAINSHTKVCLAEGTYPLSTPLTLRANTIFFGCPGLGNCGSILTYGFTPSQQSWLIETENSASATTYLMDICTDPGNANYLGSLHWMAGKNSVIRTVRFDKSWDACEMDLIRLYFSGNGGGRVFNYQDEKNVNGASILNSLNHRKVKVSGTSQQLTFYGLNLERGGSYTIQSSFPMLEMANAANIEIFGAKSEALQPYAQINNCKNIFLTNIIDYAPTGKGNTKQNYLEISGSSDNIEISNAMFLYPPDASYKIVSDPWNANTPDRTMHMGLYHRNFTSFFNTDSIPTAVSEYPLKLNKLIVYPNPTNSDCNINYASNQNLTISGKIYSLTGKVLNAFNISSNETKRLYLSNIPSGIYLIVFQTPQGQKDCLKVIKY